MITAREIIPSSLENALLASRVLVGFEELRLGNRTSNAKNSIDAAIKFFRRVQDGQKWVKEREVSSGALESSLAYRETIRAIRRVPKVKEWRTASSAIEQMLSAVKDLELGKTNAEGLDRLTIFFRSVRDASLGEDKRSVETLSIAK